MLSALLRGRECTQVTCRGVLSLGSPRLLPLAVGLDRSGNQRRTSHLRTCRRAICRRSSGLEGNSAGALRTRHPRLAVQGRGREGCAAAAALAQQSAYVEASARTSGWSVWRTARQESFPLQQVVLTAGASQATVGQTGRPGFDCAPGSQLGTRSTRARRATGASPSRLPGSAAFDLRG